MKDGMSEWMYLVAAIFALEALTSFDTVVARTSDAAFRAGWHVAVGLFKNVGKTGIIVRKLSVELVNRVPHYLLVYDRGYMLSRDSLAIQYLDSMEGFGSELARSDESLAEALKQKLDEKKKKD